MVSIDPDAYTGHTVKKTLQFFAGRKILLAPNLSDEALAKADRALAYGLDAERMREPANRTEGIRMIEVKNFAKHMVT